MNEEKWHHRKKWRQIVNDGAVRKTIGIKKIPIGKTIGIKKTHSFGILMRIKKVAFVWYSFYFNHYFFNFIAYIVQSIDHFISIIFFSILLHVFVQSINWSFEASIHSTSKPLERLF